MERLTYLLKRLAKGHESFPPAVVRHFVAHPLLQISKQSLRAPQANFRPSAQERSPPSSPRRVLYLCAHRRRPTCRLGIRTPLPRARRSTHLSRPSAPRPPVENPRPLSALVPDRRALYSLLLPRNLIESYSTVRQIEDQAGVSLIRRQRLDLCIPSRRSMSRNATVWLLLKEREQQQLTTLGRHYHLKKRPLLRTFLFRCPSGVQRVDRC